MTWWEEKAYELGREYILNFSFFLFGLNKREMKRD
jgi:hypothetical protein